MPMALNTVLKGRRGEVRNWNAFACGIAGMINEMAWRARARQTLLAAKAEKQETTNP